MPHAKSAEAFRTISEASEELNLPQHVLRHWEDVFGQIRPMRRAGGRRYYRPVDIDLLRGVQYLLYTERYTTRGVQQIFKDNGVKYIAELGRMAAAGQPIDLRPAVKDATEAESAAISEKPPGTPPGAIAAEQKGLPGETRAELTALVKRLEKAQSALDEAVIALEAMSEDEEPQQ